MCYKQNLNSLLRLRLLFSSEKELSKLIGYELHGNHFNRMNNFRCEAFFNNFAKDCLDRTLNRVNLHKLLKTYQSTSEFYSHYISGTKLTNNIPFLAQLVRHSALGESDPDATARTREICEKFTAKGASLSAGILILISTKIIPTFNNKSAQDVKNIIDDFQKARQILTEIAARVVSPNKLQQIEFRCFGDWPLLIRDELNGEKSMCRLLLIDTAEYLIRCIQSIKQPRINLAELRNAHPLQINMPRFWCVKSDPINIFWETERISINGWYKLHRHEIDYRNHQILTTSCQIFISSYLDDSLCRIRLVHPQYIYKEVINLPHEPGEVADDYSELVYDPSGNISRIDFRDYSPLGAGPLSLSVIKEEDKLKYFSEYLERPDFERVDTLAQFAMTVNEPDVAISDTAILFLLGDTVYRLDKFDEQGRETIPGISELTLMENFVTIILNDKGRERVFLGLDSLSVYLEAETLENLPFFYPVDDPRSIF